jgi:hypothetical protein
MSYSRRELYALGEPLGNSATQLKADKSRIYGGGGGDPGPTNTTVQNSNLPEYVQPYVESMLGAAQQQVYTFNPNGTVSGFKGYTPYSNNMDNYVAGFSPMQQQSFQGAANLRTPGQFGQASQMAGMAGLGSLGVAGQAGQAGNNYFGMATSTPTVNQFMNPYLQNALNPALDESRRQYGITGQQQQGNATRAGAFGGSREALMASENNRNMNTAMNQMIGTGYQNAYDSAQRNILSGNQLGLQGQQAALQGYNQLGQAAGALGQLGQQQFNTQKDIIGMQNQYGGQQQAAEQQKINQAIQNYATAQQYPMMQLGNISNLLRGLPMQSTTTQSYQAGPSGLNTLAGIGTGIAGAAQLMKAEGGTVKSYKGGGITSLANRQSIAEDLNPEQLDQVIKNGTIPPTIGRAIKEDNLRDSKAASMMAGIDTAPTNLPVVSAAQGGIISFSTGNLVQPEYGLKPKDLESTDTTALQEILNEHLNRATNKPYTEEEIADKRRKKEEKIGIKNLYPEREKEFEKTQAGIADQKNTARALALLEASGSIFENANKPGFVGIGSGIKSGVASYAPALKDINLQETNLRKDRFLAQDAQNAMLQAQMSGDDKAYNDARSAFTQAKTNIINAENQDKQARNAVRGDAAKAQYNYATEIQKQILENMSKERIANTTSGGAAMGHIASIQANNITEKTSAQAKHDSVYTTEKVGQWNSAIKNYNTATQNGKKEIDSNSDAARAYTEAIENLKNMKKSQENIATIDSRYKALIAEAGKRGRVPDDVMQKVINGEYLPKNEPETGAPGAVDTSNPLLRG